MKKLISFFAMINSAIFAEDIISKPVCMSWHQALLVQWQSMSGMYKALTIVAVGLVVVGLYKLLFNNKKCSCGCMCGLNGPCDE